MNSFYVSINGKPAIPVMGEFHYSRYPAEQWEEQILKIKAGGVNVIPTYVSGIYTKRSKAYLTGRATVIYGNSSSYARSMTCLSLYVSALLPRRNT